MTASAPRARMASALRPGRARREAITGWLLVMPFTVVFVAFLIVPLVYAFWISLHSTTLAGAVTFTGMQNYVRAIQDPDFITGALRVARFGLVIVPAQLLIGGSLAIVLDSLASRLSRVARLVYFVPYAVPAVIASLMWGFIYSPAFGPATLLSKLLGTTIAPLSSSGILASLVNIVVWQGVGYNTLILYAALRGVDPTLYEAARIDGANAWQIALRIKVPLMRPALVLIALFTVIGAFQLFAEPQSLRPIASGSIDAAFTPNMYAYNLAFSFQQYNYAAAISFILGFIVFTGTLIFTVLNNRHSRKAR